jgi:hypothetical protein
LDQWLTQIEGDGAAIYDAVSLSSFMPVNQGVLVSANALNGEVKWKDKTGESHTANVGEHAIRIIRKSR